jgi:hypothetical protein
MRVALALLLGLAVVGCGGGDGPRPLTKAAYEQRAGAILRELPGRDDPFTPGTLDDETQAAADALAALEPPPEIRDQHLLLVDGLAGLAEDLRAAATAMNEGSAEFQAALERVAASPGGEQAEEALRRLNARGYRLPPVFGAG